MRKSGLKKAMLAAAAATMAFGALPAEAGGHGYGHHGWSHGRYKPSHHYYYGHNRHRGGLSGAEAAVIAAGIIGGAILIDRALDNNDRYGRAYDDPYYGPRYDAPYGGGGADYYYRRDDRPYSYDEPYLEGAYGGDTNYNYGAAYNDCKAETRAAADQGGLFVALPAKPQEIRPIGDGTAVRFTADFIAQDGRGGEFRKTMICEADLDGVRFLELV